MNPKKLQGILWLADLQDDYQLVDCKKLKDQNLVVCHLERIKRSGICSNCGERSNRIHATNEIELRDLPAFAYKIKLLAERFILNCENCNKIAVEEHWLVRKKKSFTWRYEQRLSRMCEEMTNIAVSRLEDIPDKTIYRIDYELLKERLTSQLLPELGPHYSMDEVYFRGNGGMQESYVTNLLDLGHKKVISNCPGRGASSAEGCLMWLSKHQKRGMESIATDLHAPYHKAIAKHCPNADVVLDRFHIMKLFSEAMNDFRKEQLRMSTDINEMQLLKGRNKWLLLARSNKLSKKDQYLLEELKVLNERVIEALIIKEQLTGFFDSPNLRVAKVNWYNLKKTVREANIKQLNEFFRKLERWSAKMWNYFKHKTSSAVIEALNHKIKAVKWMAYGYRNLHYYQLKILQRVGFLNTQFAPITRPVST